METTLRSPITLAWQRWCGAAFILGNILFIINKLNEMSRLFFHRSIPDVISGQNAVLILAGQAGLLVGYTGFYRLYAPRLGSGGKTALRLFYSGGILLALGHIGFISALQTLIPARLAATAEKLFILIIAGVLLLVIGLIWLGVYNLRARVLARWQWLPLATGLLGFIGFVLFSGEVITATFLVFRTLFAVGLLGLGVVMWLEQTQ